jgi:DNA-binding MarR family transcriptional regulator
MPGTARRRTTAVADGVSRPAPTARSRLELQTLQALRTVFASARLHDAEVRRVAGISGSQLWALSEIARSSAMSVNALSRRMALHQTTASNLVHALLKRKLIHRTRDGSDQRVVQLHLSPEGRRILEHVPGPHAGLLVDALRDLEHGQLARLCDALAVLVGVMQRPATSAAGETLMGE